MKHAPDRSDFAVFVWLRKTERFAALKSEVLVATETAPCETTEFQGMAYFHWSARDFNEAKRLIDALAEAARHPELILVQIMSRVYGEEYISIKDERRVRL